MNRSERNEFNAQQFAIKRIARQANVAIAEGFVHVSKGKRYYKNGVGQPKGGERGKR